MHVAKILAAAGDDHDVRLWLRIGQGQRRFMEDGRLRAGELRERIVQPEAESAMQGRDGHLFEYDSAQKLCALAKETCGRAAMKSLNRSACNLPSDFRKLQDFNHASL